MKTFRPFINTFLVFAAALCCFSSALQLNGEDYGPITVLPLSIPENRGESTEHGYVEYQFRITNRDKKAHRVELSSRADGNFGYRVCLRQIKTNVEVPAETSVLVRMLQPPVVMYDTRCVVSIDGIRQETELHGVLANSHCRRYSYPLNSAAVLVSQGVPADSRDLIRTAYRPPLKPAAAAETGAITPTVSSGGENEPKVIPWLSSVPVTEWSDSFLFYTRFDCVMLTVKEYNDLETGKPAVLSAVRKYAELGGLLCIVVDDGKNPDLKIPQDWNDTAYSYEGNDYQTGFGFGDIYILGKLKGNEDRINPFRRAVLGKSNHFDNSVSQSTLLSQLPVISHYGIPIKLILVLIFLFAFIIGPANVFVLHYLKRRIWLLWTVPLLSFLACVIVLGASLIQEGLLFQSSSISFTVLNQRSGTALTAGYAGYYSTFTPGALTFSPDTEATLCYEKGYADNPVVLEYELKNGSQSFSDGWIQARIPSYFFLRKAQSQRKERINFDFSGGEATAVNGFGADIRRLTVRSLEGQLYEAENIKAGEKIVLKKSDLSPSKPEVHKTTAKLQEKYLQLFGYVGYAAPVSFEANDLSSGNYSAEMDVWNPFLEPGLEKLNPYRNSTVVIGLF